MFINDNRPIILSKYKLSLCYKTMVDRFYRLETNLGSSEIEQNFFTCEVPSVACVFYLMIYSFQTLRVMLGRRTTSCSRKKWRREEKNPLRRRTEEKGAVTFSLLNLKSQILVWRVLFLEFESRAEIVLQIVLNYIYQPINFISLITLNCRSL